MRIVYTYFLVIFLFADLTAQVSQNQIILDAEKVDFISDKLSVSADETILTLVGNAQITIPTKLTIQADSIQINKIEKRIVAYRVKSFQFTGQAKLLKMTKSTIRYTIGKQVLFIGDE